MHKAPGILFDNRYFEHGIEQHSPENANRIRGLYNTLKNDGYRNKLCRFDPREATTEEVQSVHSNFYVSQVREHAAAENPYSYDRDTYLMEKSLYTANLAAGGCVQLTDKILAGEIDYGFALIRPPGHHAEIGRGMGFCVFNNIAIVAQYLRNVYGLERILVIDFDVHHCNGTQSIFYESNEVLVVSIHQDKIFPFTGKSDEIGVDSGKGYTINLPVYQQFSDREYTFLLSKVLNAVVEQYLPQMILVSAGYDGHEDDTISKTLLSTSWYGNVTKLLKNLAGNVCNDRLLFVLEGGYNPESLEESVLATIDELLQPSNGVPGVVYSERAARVLEDHPLHLHWTI